MLKSKITSKYTNISLVFCFLVSGYQTAFADSPTLDKSIFSSFESSELGRKAVRSFESGRYIDSVSLWYNLKQNSEGNSSTILAAAYAMASALHYGEFELLASRYHEQLVRRGPKDRLFFWAVKELASIADSVGDDTLLPQLIASRQLADYERLDADGKNAVYYMIGMLAQRKNDSELALDLLGRISSNSQYYARALYLLGIVELELSIRSKLTKYPKSLKYFTEIENLLKNAKDDSNKKLYRLALLGKARTYYSQQDYIDSVSYYEKVPRFSDDWYDAMFESGWAYFQNGDLGTALGMVHSIQSPYFEDRNRAESFILQATVYFRTCHFELVRQSAARFETIYGPIIEKLEGWLAEKRSDQAVFEAIELGNSQVPNKIRNSVTSNRRYRKFLAQLRKIEEEEKLIEAKFDGSLAKELRAVAQSEKQRRLSLLALLIRAQLGRELKSLKRLAKQAKVTRFETIDAERRTLEAGSAITKSTRQKAKRFFVTRPQAQFWQFNQEYWIDELGYYRYQIENICTSELLDEQ